MERPLASASFSLGLDSQQSCSVPATDGMGMSDALAALKGQCMEILRAHLEANSISATTTDDPMPWDDNEEGEEDEEPAQRPEKQSSKRKGNSHERGAL